MEHINHDSLRELLDHRGGIGLSLYVPLNGRFPERRQHRIRVNNLLKQAQEALSAKISSSEAKKMVEPVAGHLEAHGLAPNGSRGVAFFAGEDFFREFALPIAPAEACVVGERFSIAPLLPLLHYDGRFFVLALSQKEARLYETTRDTISEWELAEKPPSEDGAALRTQSFPLQGRGALAESALRGQGEEIDRTDQDLLEYCRAVDRSVTQALSGQTAPLVLACVEHLAPVYASANRYPHLMVGCVSGNFDRQRLDALRIAAWEFVAPHFEEVRRQAAANFGAAQGSGLALDEPREIVAAAEAGRVATLLVEEGACRIAGGVRAGEDAVDETVEMVELAAAETVLHGGDIIALEHLPTESSPAAAVLRY